MSLPAWLERVFCPARYELRKRMEPMLAEAAADLGVPRLAGHGVPLAEIMQRAARDFHPEQPPKRLHLPHP